MLTSADEKREEKILAAWPDRHPPGFQLIQVVEGVMPDTHVHFFGLDDETFDIRLYSCQLCSRCANGEEDGFYCTMSNPQEEGGVVPYLQLRFRPFGLKMIWPLITEDGRPGWMHPDPDRRINRGRLFEPCKEGCDDPDERRIVICPVCAEKIAELWNSVKEQKGLTAEREAVESK